MELSTLVVLIILSLFVSIIYFENIKTQTISSPDPKELLKEFKTEKNRSIEIRMLNFPLFESMIIIDPLSIERGQIYFEHIFFPTQEKTYRNIFRILKRSKNTDKENIFKNTYDIFLNQWNKAILIQ